LGRTYTRVGGARTRREFMERLRSGDASLHGACGGYWTLTRAVLRLSWEMMREKRWTTLLAPLALAVPFVTLANACCEMAFVFKWAPRTVITQLPAPLWPDPQGYPETGL